VTLRRGVIGAAGLSDSWLVLLPSTLAVRIITVDPGRKHPRPVVAAHVHDRATGLLQLRDIVQPDLPRTPAGSGNSRKNAAAHVLVDLLAVLECGANLHPLRSLAALQALRTQVRDVTNAAPAVFELTGPKNQTNSRNDG
jgi:hypothetical protein